MEMKINSLVKTQLWTLQLIRFSWEKKMAQQLKGVVEMEVDEEICQPKMKEKATEGKLDIKEEKLETVCEGEEFEFDIGRLSLSELERLTEGYVFDESEETVLMTREEMNKYIKQKMIEYSKNPEINPLLHAEEQAKELLKKLKEKQQELLSVQDEFKVMYSNQIKFFEHIGILPKEETRSVGVSADFPILPQELPPLELMTRGEYFVDLPSCKVLRPSTKSDSAFKKSELIPESEIKVECIDISYDKPIKSNDACIQPIHDAPAESSYGVRTKSTSSTPAKSTCIAPTMLSHGVPIMSSGAPTKSAHTVHSEPTQETPTFSAPTRSFYNAHAEPVICASANSGATGGAPTMEPSAPLLLRPYNAHIITLPNVPPKPCLELCNGEGGIILQWNMPSNIPANTYGRLISFEIYGYQDQNRVPFSKTLWQKIGEVNAMDLPMACTLTQFKDGRKYYFTMRAMDIFKRFGSFSDPVSIIFNKAGV